MTAGTLVLIVLGLTGHVVRDRSVVFAVLMYIPLLPVGLAAVCQDLLRRGRSLPRVRFGLAALGLLASVLSAGHLWAFGSASASATASQREITLVHWNVRWGGKGDTPEEERVAWASITADIHARNPDIVVLSEGPIRKEIGELTRLLGPEWTDVRWYGAPRKEYAFMLAVCSRWPLRIDRQERITDGAAMTVSVMVPGQADAAPAQPLRVLVVDGESNLRLPRGPRLADVMRLCQEARDRGEPVDVIAGDFNCVGRSLGFDAFRDAGYQRASDRQTGWRGTYPDVCPLFDIDHVWLDARLPIRQCELFGNHATDHRGHLVRFGCGR